MTVGLAPGFGLTVKPALYQQLAAAIDPTLVPGPVDIAPVLFQQLAAAFDPILVGGVPPVETDASVLVGVIPGPEPARYTGKFGMKTPIVARRPRKPRGPS